MTLDCAVFRGRRNHGAYLFVDAGEGLARVPEALLQQLGGADFALQLDLGPGRRLARVTAVEVLQKIAQQGFYLQMPPLPDAVVLPGAVPKC